MIANTKFSRRMIATMIRGSSKRCEIGDNHAAFDVPGEVDV